MDVLRCLNEVLPASSTSADPRQELALTVKERVRALLADLVDCGLAFHQLMELGERLRAGELALRTVVDVGGESEGSAEEDVLAAFATVADARAKYLRD